MPTSDVNITDCPTDEVLVDGYSSEIPSALNVASKDKFLLVVTIPKILKPYQQTFVRDQSKFDSDTLMYKLYGVNLPPVKVPSIKTQSGGYTVKLSSHVKTEYEPVKVNFVIDSGYQNYHFIYKWLDVLAGDDSGNFDDKNLLPNGKGRLKEYSTAMTVFALDEYDRAVAEFIFQGAFVTDLGGIEYNYQTEKEIQSTFTFEYTFFKMQLIQTPFTIHAI